MKQTRERERGEGNKQTGEQGTKNRDGKRMWSGFLVVYEVCADGSRDLNWCHSRPPCSPQTHRNPSNLLRSYLANTATSFLLQNPGRMIRGDNSDASRLFASTLCIGDR
jgi:hypothetical protein